MFRFAKLALPVILSLVSGLVLAGGPDCHKAGTASNVAHAGKKSNMSAEDCKKAMAEMKGRGRIGLTLYHSEDGVRAVTKVHPGSPAEKAGFREGDVLLALNGVTLNEANEDKIHSIRKGLKPGDTVTYNVKRGDREESISAVLAPMPDDVYTAMVNEHMKEHADLASAK